MNVNPITKDVLRKMRKLGFLHYTNGLLRMQPTHYQLILISLY